MVGVELLLVRERVKVRLDLELADSGRRVGEDCRVC